MRTIDINEFQMAYTEPNTGKRFPGRASGFSGSTNDKYT